MARGCGGGRGLLVLQGLSLTVNSSECYQKFQSQFHPGTEIMATSQKMLSQKALIIPPLSEPRQPLLTDNLSSPWKFPSPEPGSAPSEAISGRCLCRAEVNPQ